MRRVIYSLILVFMLASLLPVAVNAADVKIGENQEMIVDGKPFFMLGVGGPVRFFNYYKKLGINTVSASPAFAKGFTSAMCLDAAKKLGFYATCGIDEMEQVDRNHAALIGWDQVDEPDYLERDQPGYISKLIETYNKAHSLDKKPVYVCFGSMFAGGNPPIKNAKYKEYADKTADIIMTDIYPVSNVDEPDRLDLMAKGVKNCQKACGNKKPTIIAVECAKISDKAKRAANAYEVRSEVWIAIVAGVKGIYYFPHRFDKIRYTPCAINEDVEEEMMKLNKEVTDLAPVILSKNSSASVESEGGTSGTMLKEKDGKYYLFTVNMKKDPAKLKFKIAGISGEAEVYGEGRKVKINGNAIEDDFKGFQSHNYVIKK